MDFDPATIVAISVIALAASKLFWLLGMQLMGDASEIRQLAKLKSYRNKRAYRPRVSVVVIGDKSQQNITAQLDTIFDSTYANFDVVVAAPAGSAAYNQARYYRQKRGLGKRLRIVKATAGKAPLVSALRAVSGSITLVMNSSVSLLPGTIMSGVQPFRDRKLKLAAPSAYPQLDNRVASAIRGFATLFAQHLGRTRRHKVPASAQALFIRSTTLRKSSNIADLSVPAIRDTLAGMPSNERLRTPQAAVHVSPLSGSSQAFRPQPLYTALIALIDVFAVVLLFQLLGVRQAAFMLLLAALFVFILAAISVLSAKPVSVISKLNLILSAPFAYIANLANAIASIGYYAIAPIIKVVAK